METKMKKYTYAAYDRKGRLVELTVIAETKGEADKLARGIFHSSFEFIDTDEGIFLNDEEDYNG